MPTIAKNTAYLTIASVGQKLFSFIYFSLLARFLGVEQIGLYATVLSFTTIFLVLVDMGFTPILIREGARDKNKISKILGQVLSSKLIFGLLTYLILSLVIYFIRGHYLNPQEFQKLIAIMGVSMVLNSFSTTLYGALRSFQNLRYEAASIIFSQLVIVISGLGFLWWTKSIFLLFVALGLGDIFGICFSSYVLWKKYNVRPKFIWDKALFKYIFILAVPFALAGVFTKVYSAIDHVLLSYILGTKQVGFYSIPSKIAFAFQFIPIAFAAALYPAMSYFFVQDKTRLKTIFEKGLFYLAMIALPISFGVIAIADVFITKVYGTQFQPSILPLKILVASLIFAFLDFPIGSLLNACNLQRIQTSAMGISMILNIIFNLILIPKFGVIGAALAAFLTNFILAAIGYFYIPKIVTLPNWSFWGKILKIFLCSALMGLLVVLIKQQLLGFLQPLGFIHTLIFLSILIISGGLFYLAFLWIFRVLRKEEVEEFIDIIKR